MNKAIFIDRDGTLNIDINYAYKIEDCILVEKKLGEILKKLKHKGYLLVVITNQAGIDKGYYTKKNFWDFMKELERQLDLKFDGIYFCPYHPDYSGESECRKPNNGMLLQAQKELNIDLKKSFMIGDNEKDIIAGNKSGCKTILYNSQNLDIEDFKIKPDFVVNSWKEIEEIILN